MFVISPIMIYILCAQDRILLFLVTIPCVCTFLTPEDAKRPEMLDQR